MAHKCFGIYIMKNNTEKLLTDFSQFHFLARPHVKKLLHAGINEIKERTYDNSIININLEEYNISVTGYILPNSMVLIFTTENCTDHLVVLAQYLSIKKEKETIVENFDFIKNQMKIKNIQEEIAETQNVVVNTVDKLLERKERLDDLLEKTKYLDEESKLFYKKAKKLNQWCCQIV